MSGRQGRQESSIDPAKGPQAVFAQQLRDLRKACGSPTYRELASWSRKIKTPYSDTTLSSAARGHELPSWEVTSAFVRACLSCAKTDTEQIEASVAAWESRWQSAKAELSPNTPPAGSRQEGAGPPEGEPAAPKAVAPHVPEPRRWLRLYGKRVGWAAAGIVAATGAVVVARAIATPGDETAGTASPSASTSSVAPASPAGQPSALPSASGVDEGLGGDYRCARPRFLNGLSWTPCTRVDATKLVFVVQLTNSGPDSMKVKTRLGYVRATVPHPCPEQWGNGVELTVKPGASVMSPAVGCVVDKQPASAFQAVAWVIPAAQTEWGYREMSPTAHVQADGRAVVWGGG